MLDTSRIDAAEQQTLADPSYRRDLGDGLLLRWSTAADADRLATFYGLVFRYKADSPPNARIPVWLRDMLGGGHPLIGEDGFALVEHTPTGEVVAATCLLSEAWEYDGIRIPLGRPEIVGSLPAYRRRGLVREVFRLIHARSQSLGHLAQGITGIEWYYRQYGYEYALGMPPSTRIALASIPAAKDGEQERFTLRQATEADVDAVARLYDAERAGHLVSTPIVARYWRFGALETNPKGGAFERVVVVVDASGAVVGYALTSYGIWQGAFGIDGLWLKPGLWFDALPAVLRGLRSYAESAPPAEPSAPASPAHTLDLWLPSNHPALLTLASQSIPAPRDTYAWYVRVADLPALLRTLAPALERRLAASPFAGYSGELTFDFFRGGLRMLWRDGHLAEVAEWQRPMWSEVSAAFPPGVFLQLLFGYRDLTELRHAFPDVGQNGAAHALLPTLFPKRESWVIPLG